MEKKNINAITYITQKKGKIRGNHFHEKTIQWNYLLKGRVELTTKKNKQKIKKTLMKEGDLIETSKNEAHATRALKTCNFFNSFIFNIAGYSFIFLKQYSKDFFR